MMMVIVAMVVELTKAKKSNSSQNNTVLTHTECCMKRVQQGHLSHKVT